MTVSISSASLLPISIEEMKTLLNNKNNITFIAQGNRLEGWRLFLFDTRLINHYSINELETPFPRLDDVYEFCYRMTKSSWHDFIIINR